MQVLRSPLPIGGLCGSGMYIVSRCGFATVIVGPQSAPGYCRLCPGLASSKEAVGTQPPCGLFDTMEFLNRIWTGVLWAAITIAEPTFESTVLFMKSASS